MELRQQYQNMSLETLEATLAGGKLSPSEESICKEVIQEKKGESETAARSQNQTTHAEVVSDYKTGIGAAKLISFAGWLVVMGGVIFGGFLFYQSAGIMKYADGETVFLAVLGILGSALGVMMSGVMMIAAGQAARAVMDNVNLSRQMLKIMKNPGHHA